MNYDQIRGLLDAQLNTVIGLPTLQTENTRVTPGKLPWSRSTLLTAEPTPLTVGFNGMNEYQGIYQVDLFYPQDRGTNVPGAMAADVSNVFMRGLLLTDGDITVQIQMAWQGTSYQVESWYGTPVFVRWVCFSE